MIKQPTKSAWSLPTITPDLLVILAVTAAFATPPNPPASMGGTLLLAYAVIVWSVVRIMGPAAVAAAHPLRSALSSAHQNFLERQCQRKLKRFPKFQTSAGQAGGQYRLISQLMVKGANDQAVYHLSFAANAGEALSFHDGITFLNTLITYTNVGDPTHSGSTLRAVPLHGSKVNLLIHNVDAHAPVTSSNFISANLAAAYVKRTTTCA